MLGLEQLSNPTRSAARGIPHYLRMNDRSNKSTGSAHFSSPGNSANNKKRLRSRRYCFRQRGVRQFMGPIFRAGEEPQERAALLRNVVANCPAQHGITGFERVEDRALRDLAFDVEIDFDIHFAANARQRSQMCGKLDADHRSSRHFLQIARRIVLRCEATPRSTDFSACAVPGRIETITTQAEACATGPQ